MCYETFRATTKGDSFVLLLLLVWGGVGGEAFLLVCLFCFVFVFPFVCCCCFLIYCFFSFSFFHFLLSLSPFLHAPLPLVVLELQDPFREMRAVLPW